MHKSTSYIKKIERWARTYRKSNTESERKSQDKKKEVKENPLTVPLQSMYHKTAVDGDIYPLKLASGPTARQLRARRWYFN